MQAKATRRAIGRDAPAATARTVDRCTITQKRSFLTDVQPPCPGPWQVHSLLWTGHTDVVDADLSKYFDTIPHSELMSCVARRIVDRMILSLIKMWLKAPVEERDRDGTRRMSGGKASKHGTPQGGVISPLLANLYINRFLRFWRSMQEKTRAYRAHIVAYADDFVILSRGHADEALSHSSRATLLAIDRNACPDRVGTAARNRRNGHYEAKTSLKDARKERFDFLGYTFGPHRRRRDGKRYLGYSPS